MAKKKEETPKPKTGGYTIKKEVEYDLKITPEVKGETEKPAEKKEPQLVMKRVFEPMQGAFRTVWVKE